MSKRWIAVIALAVLLAARPSSACDLIYRATFPMPDVVRLTGSVVAYATISSSPSLTLPTLSPGPPAGLRIAVREVVSGPVRAPEAVVAVLPHGPGCDSFAATREMLERDYPLGTTVAVRGRATRSVDVPVVVESTQWEFVTRFPAAVPRTPFGDLDFRSRDIHLLGSIVDFECDRAILRMAERTSGDRFARLLNLGSCRSWHAIPDALAHYRTLVSASGLEAPAQAELLVRFRETHPLVK
jgi:hypothetical protein